ncbi:unnamed protein product [Enterobius vermicularis]|uniref:Uncharacterized protein n=1 Tax=Enterobius vermicularis TaxID=51028 RepID=A0A0N4VG75_ENTVE|nr:unnamed protein product [Enterobius vermicularis]
MTMYDDKRSHSFCPMMHANQKIYLVDGVVDDSEEIRDSAALLYICLSSPADAGLPVLYGTLAEFPFIGASL